MRKYLIALGAAVALIGMSGVAAQATPAGAGGGLPAPGNGVAAKPVTGTPHFSVTHANPIEQVRQLVQCGGTMYAVGSFSQILQGGSTYTRHNAFSFRATAPFTVTSWAPRVNGTVNSIAFRSGACSRAYIGGSFSSVNGVKAKNIAEVTTGTGGGVVRSFAHTASAQVNTLTAVNGHVLVGGDYTSINGSSADPYMTSLNARTGKNDGFLHLNISGHFTYAGYNTTKIYNQALSHSGMLDLAMGDFTSVGGKNRQQIFMLNVGGSKAKLTGWTSPAFTGHCAAQEPAYVQAASWSPGDGRIYIATTGRYYFNRPANTFPLKGLCDAAAAFPATQASVNPIWINYTGCDTLRSTAADASTAYFGGHERWSMNPNGCNYQGPGAYNATGMEGLSPTNGALYLNKVKTAGYYERSRGIGADDMLLTGAGLWIASDNEGNSQTCGFVSGLSGICFLPYG